MLTKIPTQFFNSNALYCFRSGLRLNQDDFGYMVDITRPNLSKLECGLGCPSFNTFSRLMVLAADVIPDISLNDFNNIFFTSMQHDKVTIPFERVALLDMGDVRRIDES